MTGNPRLIHPAHVTVTGHPGTTGVDLSIPCGCRPEWPCPCACHTACPPGCPAPEGGDHDHRDPFAYLEPLDMEDDPR